MASNKQVILDFYQNFIEGFIIGDLEVLDSIKPDTISGLKGCAIPTAMTIISTIELLGFLLNKGSSTSDSSANIKFFLHYNGNSFFPHNYFTGDVEEKICNYRQGMMHHFFPKFKGGVAGICKNDNDENLFITIRGREPNEESLNVSILTRDFFEALNRFKVYLEEEQDDNFFNSIKIRLKDLEYNIEIYPQTTSCTTICPGTPQNRN